MIFSYLLNMQSHPSWVCGLKHVVHPHKQAVHKVTPFVGVWIETLAYHKICNDHYVTPFVGVWIETNGTTVLHIPIKVTPFVGVWIET